MASQKITYSFVVARSRDFVIGCDNELPWRLPTDLRQFKKITVGKPIIMGRRTYESIGHALPDRPNIVISRENGLSDPNISVVHSKQEAMFRAEVEARRLGVHEVVVVGGAEVFVLFGDEVDKVYLTEVKTEISEGDAHYDRDFSNWHLIEERRIPKREGKDQYDFAYSVYERPTRRCVQRIEEKDIGLISSEPSRLCASH